MDASMIDSLKMFGEKFGLAGVILLCWMWTDYRKEKQLVALVGNYHILAEKALKTLTKVKLMMQLKLTGALDDEDEEN